FLVTLPDGVFGFTIEQCFACDRFVHRLIVTSKCKEAVDMNKNRPVVWCSRRCKNSFDGEQLVVDVIILTGMDHFELRANRPFVLLSHLRTNHSVPGSLQTVAFDQKLLVSGVS